MNFILQLLAAGTRKGSFPLIVFLAGWYGGAKIGAPDFVMNSVDGLIARGGSAIESMLGREEPAPAEDDGA